MSQPVLDHNQKNRAKIPHTIFNMNVLFVHIFALVVLFEFNLIHWIWMIPITSLSIMLFQYRHMRLLLSDLKDNDWYVVANWNLAIRHNRILLIAYLVCGSIFLTGYTISSSMTTDPNMSNISMMIFLYLSGMLMLLTLIVTFVLSSGAIWHTEKGEVTHALEKIKIDLEASRPD
jgi:hypothetical protein